MFCTSFATYGQGIYLFVSKELGIVGEIKVSQDKSQKFNVSLKVWKINDFPQVKLRY